MADLSTVGRFVGGAGYAPLTVDGSLEFADRSEDAAFEVPFGEFGEEAFDGIETR